MSGDATPLWLPCRQCGGTGWLLGTRCARCDGAGGATLRDAIVDGDVAEWVDDVVGGLRGELAALTAERDALAALVANKDAWLAKTTAALRAERHARARRERAADAVASALREALIGLLDALPKCARCEPGAGALAATRYGMRGPLSAILPLCDEHAVAWDAMRAPEHHAEPLRAAAAVARAAAALNPEPTAFARASGETLCEACTLPYRAHPTDPRYVTRDGAGAFYGWLRVLCDGRLVKL